MRFILPAAIAACLAGCTTVAIDALQPAPTTVAAGVQAPVPLPASVPSDLPRNAMPLHYRIEITPDIEGLAFDGTASIDLVVFEPSDAITLHGYELEISSARLLGPGETQGTVLSAELDGAAQTLRLSSRRSINPGRYRLDLVYTGKINTQANGLFRLSYPDKRTGEEVHALFTQFEAPDARRFAPMFDEPSYKATFDLSAVVPAGLMAISNMPVASEVDLGNALKRVSFGTSPKMSSYLLFFGLGDFERVTMPAANGTEVGIVAPAGSGSQSRYALESLAPLVGYYNDYFGVKYPLPKLDNIAGPGQSQFFGAMENWGAIFTFESVLLEDPAITSAATRQRIFTFQAHETAHQWFGNIVTMAWWDDLWLNEGFASWMETKTTDHFNPEWYALLGRVGGREEAMRMDSLATTHPVVQTIRTVEETNQAFDAIAYQKGEAVIAMLEAYAGEDVWRDGLRGYMAQHQYGNTTSDDLWRAVEQAGATGLTEIAHDFTRQPGIPLVNASSRCEAGTTKLQLTQGEFSRDRAAQVAANPQSWRVPVLIASGQAPSRRIILQGSASLDLPGCDAVLVNSGQLGYFRTRYTPEMAGALAKALPGLDPIDQLGLTRDNLTLAQAGYQPFGPALDLLAAVPRDANPVVASNAVARWDNLYGTLADSADKAAVALLMRQRFGVRLSALGFEPVSEEPVADANLRTQLITTLGNMGDREVAEEARRRFARLADDPRALDGPLKNTWLAIMAVNATTQNWEMLKHLAESSSSTVEKAVYYRSLGSARDESLARRALALALSGEGGLTNSAPIITAVAQNHPEMAFEFVLTNQERVDELIDNAGYSRFIARLLGSSSDPAMLEKLQAYGQTLSADRRRPVEAAILALKERIESTPRVRQGVREWLQGRR